MAHLIFRCRAANRVVMTGVEIKTDTFSKLRLPHTMPCRFCGSEHTWEIVDKVPDAAALLSIRAEDYLARSVQSDTHAVETADPDLREMYRRMAGQWYRLAVEHEARADALR